MKWAARWFLDLNVKCLGKYDIRSLLFQFKEALRHEIIVLYIYRHSLITLLIFLIKYSTSQALVDRSPQSVLRGLADIFFIWEKRRSFLGWFGYFFSWHRLSLVNFKDMFINAVSLSRKNFLVINVQVLIKRFRKNYWLSLRNSHCVTFYCGKLAVTGICFATCEGQSCRLFVFVCRPLFSLFNSMNAQTIDEEERKKWTNSYPELSHSSFPVWVEKIERRWTVFPDHSFFY